MTFEITETYRLFSIITYEIRHYGQLAAARYDIATENPKKPIESIWVFNLGKDWNFTQNLIKELKINGWSCFGGDRFDISVKKEKDFNCLMEWRESLTPEERNALGGG